MPRQPESCERLRKNNLTDALQRFSAAVELDGNLFEARMNVGLITLGFRKYDAAREQFQKVLEIQPKNYDAVIGMGIAARGMNDLDAAIGPEAGSHQWV